MHDQIGMMRAKPSELSELGLRMSGKAGVIVTAVCLDRALERILHIEADPRPIQIPERIIRIRQIHVDRSGNPPTAPRLPR